MTTWSVDRVRTWSESPWNQHGKQLALVHHARAATKVEFAEFEAIGEWLSRVAGTEGVAIDVEAGFALAAGGGAEETNLVPQEIEVWP